MNLSKILLLVVLVDFAAFTAWVVATGGTPGEIVALFSVNPWVGQVFVDLVIALSLVSVWMWNDARSRGANPLPWLVATLLTGSIAPLTYLVVRSRDAERAAREPAVGAVSAG